MSRTLSTLERCRRMSTVLLLTLLTHSAPDAWAHKDPPGCTADSVVSVSLFALRDADNDGVPETQILSSAVPPLEHETIYYTATLAKLAGTDCAFEGGTLRITTPDGQPHDFSSIPCIGGTGCATDFTTPTTAVPYVTSNANLTGGLLKATAAYTGGFTHVGPVHGAVTGTVPLNARLLFCGDGTVSAVQRCSGSSTPCLTSATCPSGQTCVAGEACDPAAVPTGCVATSTCGADCRCSPVCGDGMVNQQGETCDDGNSVDTDDCRNDCTRCGDNRMQAADGETCDGTAVPAGRTCRAAGTPAQCTFCGDGIRQAGETCDDGNSVDTDGCRNDCTRCGDGVVQPEDGEQCDDGNDVAGDGCTACHLDVGCRITGGGWINGITDPTMMAQIIRASFGGQVGAPCGCIGCFDQSGHVQGNWTHDRKTGKGRLKASTFNSLTCSTVDGAGPAPPPAPANKACFSGVGDWSPTNGPKTMKVAYRVEVEDHGEPGKSDTYRLRMWIPTSTWTLSKLIPATCCTATSLQVATPDIDDSGTLIGGNIQIHPELHRSTDGICPVPDGVCPR